MKTTLDLPDDLLIEAKAVAARRRTTLKELVTHSLRREIAGEDDRNLFPEELYEINELGLPCLRKRGAKVNSELIYKMIEDDDEEDLQRALKAGEK